MEIVCILGSPRKNGNSATIARRFTAKAEELGANVKSFFLNELKYRGCQACMACKTKLDHCALDDDLAPVLEAVHKADVLVLAAPVYAGGVSGQFKCFLDRSFSFMKPDYLSNPNPSRLEAGKKMVFILTQGAQSEDIFNDIHPKIERLFKRHGFSETITIRGCGLAVGVPMAETRDDLMELADKTAEKIAG